ncbi:MAG: hypothetical protein ACHQUA_00265 [Microgenomates group bacterium]
MTQIVSESIKVGFSDFPKWVKWKNRVYKIDKVGFHHTYKSGKILYHVFSVTSGSFFMKIVLNTDNLSWKLEEISDGI